MATKRLFFGIGLAKSDALDIQSWLDQHVSANKAPTLMRNWHLTLAFLGQVDSRQEEVLVEFAETLAPPPFQLHFSQTGYWSHNGIFYLQPDHINAHQLLQLAEPLRHCAEQQGLYRNPHPFSPHITLFRSVKPTPQVHRPILPFSISVTQFHLYHSHSMADGLHYTPIHTFKLSA
ncbi:MULTISPECIES: RNA 2',3'-cyclic phosphodiesterase [Pseudoalteromonas]|uniref:RNA 2',3'-cyclic phosphodiesterase n=1 Tax=Pseudoalteromonas obscura TaxID=3048491 RepID=A0ABT7ERU2_9GAMM|nr:RNA 2',3'-cyclic phosphodiesterase [Pseudoalteromonas sp. P94(2023)]MBQ4839037.1 RNA 2',3'-cyclic phosphodiesterase [Pseudoalteromonas luteoviolacea]MDK2597775.1 RNA 2',3'-cyclic phosphodiesterase [Pseudoalteromonas sp. P94(2023)]